MAVWNCEGYLLGGVGICEGHTIYCDTQNDVETFMKGKQKGTFKQYSYIRADPTSKNAYQPATIHLPLPYNSATEIEYVMYKNTDVDDKRWYYGRVIEREYVNINSTRLYFEIDYWLTYHDEFKKGIKKSFVIRNHVTEVSDWNGLQPRHEYQIPEDYQIPAYEFLDNISNGDRNKSVFNSLQPEGFLVYATTNELGQYDYKAENVVNGSPTALFVEGAINYNQLGTIIKRFNLSFPLLDTSSPDNIQAVVYVPLDIAEPFNREFANDTDGIKTDVMNKEITAYFPNRGTLTRSDGKLFKNAKCFSTPYMVMVAKTFRGETINLNPERYCDNNGIIHGDLFYCGGFNSHYRCVFRERGTVTSYVPMTNEAKFINLPDYPQLSVHSDSFLAYLGHDFIGDAVKTGIDIAYTVGAPTKFMKIGGLRSAESDISNMVTQMSAPDKAVGTTTPMDSAAYENYRVVFYLRRPTIEALTSLDDYLLRYGYKLNEFRYPSFNVRKYWTYLQTDNVVIITSLPKVAVNQVQNMLNNGCTFWNIKYCEVGDYQDDNPDNE